MRLMFLFLVALSIGPHSYAEEPPTAGKVIAATIRYHDPNDRWFSSANRLVIEQTRPGGHSVKQVTFTLFPAKERFRIAFAQDGYEVSGEFDGTDCSTDPTTLSEEEKGRFRDFDCDQVRWLHRYYGYLFNAPMNLRDEGGSVDPAVVPESFEGQDAHRVTIRYGDDQPVWEYFIDTTTQALLGCRFSSGGKREDGELIVYDGEVESDGVRLPKKRSWYLHADGTLIGIDTIVEIRQET